MALYLPAPTRRAANPTAAHPVPTPSIQLSTEPQHPSYTERTSQARAAAAGGGRSQRGRFVPRNLKAFGDGGAFPEIHVAQYPRNMGNPNRKTKLSTNSAGVTSTAIVNVEVGSDGKTSYDSIVKGGSNTGKKVYSSLKDMKANRDNLDIDLPTEEDADEAAARTAAALSVITEQKVAKAKPTSVAALKMATASMKGEDAQFLKYQPDPNAPGYNPNNKERVIKIISAQLDPMEPPKHKHRKVPGGPAEDPVPILHSPPKKLTVEDQQNWKIPPCISNWKNSKGYTIPLDKRLAADGRGIQEKTINNNFATLSESLYIAERQAREEVRMRSQVQKKLAVSEKERREASLRDLAAQARAERGMGGGGQKRQPEEEDDDSDEEDVDVGESEDRGASDSGSAKPPAPPSAVDVAAQQREKLRQQRKKEREREMRLENLKGNKKMKLNEERDISEKIALGIHTGEGSKGGMDQRLYNQGGGLDSGFGADDAYSNVYSKPLFERQDGAQSIYRPTRSEQQIDQDAELDKLKDGASKRFKPDQGFAGTDTGGQRVQRDGPVQFEKGK